MDTIKEKKNMMKWQKNILLFVKPERIEYDMLLFPRSSYIAVLNLRQHLTSSTTNKVSV